MAPRGLRQRSVRSWLNVTLGVVAVLTWALLELRSSWLEGEGRGPLTFLKSKSRLEQSAPPQNYLEQLSSRLRGSLQHLHLQALVALAVAGVLLPVTIAGLKRRARLLRVLRRPYEFRDLSNPGRGRPLLQDPKAELVRIVTFIQDVVIRPIDERLPGRPFEYDMHSFPFTPMVLVIGNHSSGKSTLINKLLGTDVQETGVAPTDDGFTVLERRLVSETEDGPTVLGCPENRPFIELQRFGQVFSGHLKRKRISLPETVNMPFGLQIVDTPGMIDLPANFDNPSRGRGYNFVEVVRWWAKRADLILLLFDPDKPGTTGETLEVLTKSLAGLNHKFLVVLNKVDKLDNCLDFARAYGALGWALSKVIKRKDIPQVYTMYNAGFEGTATHREQRLPLEPFARKRNEVIEEVLRVRERHNDNVITALEETLRQVEMVSRVLTLIRAKIRRRMFELQALALLALVGPAAAAFMLWSTIQGSAFAQAAAPVQGTGLPPSAPPSFWDSLPRGWGLFGILSAYGLICLGMLGFLWEYFWQFQNLQIVGLDSIFEEAYADHFIHDDGEDLRTRWTIVKTKISSILKFVPCAAFLPRVRDWELSRLQECLDKDVWYLRQIARLLRMPGPGPDGITRAATSPFDRAQSPAAATVG